MGINLWHFFCLMEAISVKSLEGCSTSEHFPTSRFAFHGREAYTISECFAAKLFCNSRSNGSEFGGS